MAGARISLLMVFFFWAGFVPHLLSQKKIPDNFCVTLDEQLLFDKINMIREDYGKSSLEFSVSLSYVAKVHVDDLLNNNPDTSVCNLSSWSDKGEWTACCYNTYVPQQDCMWDKPKELTPFTYRGYELAGYFEDDFTVDSIINLWSSTKAVLDMILTEGNYSKKKWICMGLGFNDHYISIWFAQRADRMGEPEICTTNDTSVMAVAVNDTTLKEVTYYVVFGSFSTIKDAREAVKRYAKNGFENAGTLKADGTFRVYLNKFSSLKEAMFAKQQLPYTYREAWVYKE